MNGITMKMALLLAALAWGGCGAAAAEDAHAGHNHGPGEGHRDGEGAERQCGEHGVPEAICGICKPDTLATLRPGQSMKVRLPSAESVGLVGLEIVPAPAGAVADGIECYAEVAFDQDHLAEIAAPVAGILREVPVAPGDRVEEGGVVARLWSAAVAEAVAEAALSHQALARERRLRADGISPARDLEEAEAAHRSACQRARLLGFSEAEIDAAAQAPDAPVLLDLRAPFAGEILERAAVRGARVEEGRTLFRIADRAAVWAMLSLPEAQLARVRAGQAVEIEVDALPGRVFAGTLNWISPQLDERTRMARARAVVPDPDGVLRDRMFARARIITRTTEQAVLLPQEAVQRVGDTAVVFVREADDLYDARVVRLGAASGGRVEVAEGLRAGEPVIVAGAFSVKSQLLLSRLGAGCADE